MMHDLYNLFFIKLNILPWTQCNAVNPSQMTALTRLFHSPMPVSKDSLIQPLTSSPVVLTSSSKCLPKVWPKTWWRVSTLLDALSSPVELPPGTSLPPPGGPSTGWDKNNSSKTDSTLPIHTSALAKKMLISSLKCSEEVKNPPPSLDLAPRPLPPPLEHEEAWVTSHLRSF